MTTSRGNLMAKVRNSVKFYRVTAVYVCVMLTLILLAMVTGYTVDVQ